MHVPSIGWLTLERAPKNLSIKSSDKSDREIESTAIENGMLTLMQYGIELVKMQLTTVSELQRVCKSGV